MAKYVDNPNPYSKILDKKFTHYFILLFCLVSGAALAYWISESVNIIAGLLGYGLIVVFVLIAKWLYTQIDKNDRGEAGEWHVKKILEEFSDYYTIFQNVPIKKGLDIDFIFVGPNGIFAIEVKSHPRFGALSRSKFVHQTISEVMGLKKYLQQNGINSYITGVLVFTKSFVKYSPPRNGIYVINKDYLLTLIDRRQKIVFDQEKVCTVINNLYKNQ